MCDKVLQEEGDKIGQNSATYFMDSPLVEIVGVFAAESRWFDSTFSSHVRTLGKSFIRNCLYDGCGALCGCLAAKFDSCYSLLSSVHTLLVNIMWCQIVY